MVEYIDREAAENIFNLPIWYGEFEPYTPQSHYVLGAVGKLIREEIRKIPAADVEPVKRWIPCSERLPESCTDATYLAYVPSFGAVDIADYHPDVDEWDFMGLPVTVTHWMPLPEPPKMDGGGEDG